MKKIIWIALMAFSVFGANGCASKEVKTVDKVDIQKFMGDWYVLGGRFTPFEKGVHNGLESYKLHPDGENIDISFTYNKNSFDGELKSIPQKGWIDDKVTNSRWKVQPLWPFRFSYLIVALADDYSWTAIGVPDQDYLWIMARDWKNPEPTMAAAVKKLNEIGYDSEVKTIVPHRH